MEGVLGLVAGMCLLAGVALARWLAQPGGGLPAVPAAVPAMVARHTARWRWGGVITGLAVGGSAAGSGALAGAAVALLSWCAAVLLAPGRVVAAALPAR